MIAVSTFFSLDDDTYSERNETLLAMGYADYADYLRGDLWKWIRGRIFAAQDWCGCCGKPAAQVHHLGYEPDVLCGEHLDSLVPICARCHHLVEFDEDGEKRTFLDSFWATIGMFAKRNCHNGHLAEGPAFVEWIVSHSSEDRADSDAKFCDWAVGLTDLPL